MLPGEIDMANAGRVYRQIAAQFAGGAQVVIADLTGTTFCDTFGTRVLVQACLRAARDGSELRLLPSPQIYANVENPAPGSGAAYLSLPGRSDGRRGGNDHAKLGAQPDRRSRGRRSSQRLGLEVGQPACPPGLVHPAH
jgi:hypothetical protein